MWFSTENTGKLHATICKNSSFGDKFASVMCNSGNSVCVNHVLHYTWRALSQLTKQTHSDLSVKSRFNDEQVVSCPDPPSSLEEGLGMRLGAVLLAKEALMIL